MKRTLACVLLTLIVFALSSLHPRTVDPQQESLPSVLLPRASFDAMLPPVKGMPREEAWRILERHHAELLRLAEIEGITLGGEGIIILTDDPARLPTDVEGLPIEVRPPLRPATIAGRPYKEAAAILERHRAELSRLPDVERVGLGLEGILVSTDAPSVLPAAVEGLPIIAGPPVTHIPSSGGIPYKQAKEILDRQGDYLRGLPQVENVILGTEGILVFTDNPEVLPKDVEGLVVVPRIPDRFPRIHGLPYEEAQAIFERNQEMLRHLPGVQDVGLNLEQGLVVMTDNPAAVPKTIEGLPITILPAIKLPKTSQIVDLTSRPCPPGAFRKPGETRCRYAKPPSDFDPPARKFLPPPPGVIVLKPGNIREQADSCPEGFKEEQAQNNWRFCVDPQNPQPIPPMMVPPIAGIPFEKAQEIHLRHVEELSNLLGVQSVGLGADAIYVRTDNPELVPKEVEGVPVKTEPRKGQVKGINHTINNPVRPLRGAAAVVDNALPGEFVTLTGIALSHGRPWLISPAHALATCDMFSPCAVSTSVPLNQCSHYSGQGQAIGAD